MDVMEYYNVPERYRIPDDSGTITAVKAGEVYGSDPNQILHLQ